MPNPATTGSTTRAEAAGLGWPDIGRLGLVQATLGAVIVLATSTLNRVMVVELALPAVLPGLLVAIYHLLQLSRPNWGFRSDRGGARTPWIIGGVGILALGGVLATLATVTMADRLAAGVALAVLAFAMIGIGAGAAGTSLLALLAVATAPERRAAAAAIVWLMMIFGIATTASLVGLLLDPFSPGRLVAVVAATCGGAFLLAVLAIRGIEARTAPPRPAATGAGFAAALRETWAEPASRRFAIFVLLSMTAYFMQDLIIEPFAGHVFAFTPGQSTRMAGLQNAGTFLGMVTVGAVASGLGLGSLRFWAAAGCLISATALLAVLLGGLAGPPAPLLPAVVALGFGNGVFVVGAIGAMIQMAGEGRASREGIRMGLWGAMQAIAAGFGGLLGAGAVDLARRFLTLPSAYAVTFAAEAMLFLLAAGMALRAVPAGARLAPRAAG